MVDCEQGCETGIGFIANLIFPCYGSSSVFANRQSGADNLPMCDVDGVVVSSGDVGKCLGYCWNEDLISSKSMEENINKA